MQECGEGTMTNEIVSELVSQGQSDSQSDRPPVPQAVVRQSPGAAGSGGWLDTLGGFWTKINNDWIFNLAGLLAYNILMALFPLLLLLLAGCCFSRVISSTTSPLIIDAFCQSARVKVDDTTYFRMRFNMLATPPIASSGSRDQFGASSS